MTYLNPVDAGRGAGPGYSSSRETQGKNRMVKPMKE